jgi:shikimate kinase
MNLYLTGYRATGKSAVGQRVAEALTWQWIDTDHWVQIEAGKTISEIFAEAGEPAFRDLESRAIQHVASLDQQVVSLGGGAILRKENRELIQSSGKTIWLTATARTIASRMQSDRENAKTRPQLTQLDQLVEIEQLLRERQPLYESVADLKIDGQNKRPAEIAREIVAWFRSQVH